ncbi:MAG: DNA recombination protein RmuC [Prevotellaceae bacterium]|jgi:DNA recombination protein RmuC|nr:DNA recombination protein RmuC [Prevotellaceae bacterium]
MDYFIIIAALLAGFLTAWFILIRKQSKIKTSCDENIKTITVEKAEVEKQYSIVKATLQLKIEELFNAQQSLLQQQEIVNARNIEIATLKAVNDNFEEKLQTQKTETEILQKRLTTEFENIATRILKERSDDFSNVNQKQIGDILNPLKEKIKDFEKKVDETYNNETREKASLKEIIKRIIEINRQISDDAQKLTKALKGDSKIQGDWGEIQLEMLLEKTGLQRDIHFKKQENFKTDENANMRPDYIIYLPDNKQFIIDSKVSLTAYERYFNTDDENEKAVYLKEHIASITKHIIDLSSKNYQNLYGINSPDYVFLFVALEPALNLALQSDLTLFDKAMSRNVILVSASTLWATMRTVSFIWKQENQNKNAKDIAKESGALYDKFVNFMNDLISLGKQLDTAKNNYEEAMNKLYKSPRKGDTILGRIERIKELGANTTKALPQSLLDRIE